MRGFPLFCIHKNKIFIKHDSSAYFVIQYITLVYTHVGSISSQHRSRSAHHWGNSGLLQKERGGSSLRGETTTTAATDGTCCGYWAAREIDRRRNESPARRTYPFFNHSQGKLVLMRLQRSIASCPIVSKQRNTSIFYPNFFFSMSRKSSPRKTSNFRSSWKGEEKY